MTLPGMAVGFGSAQSLTQTKTYSYTSSHRVRRTRQGQASIGHAYAIGKTIAVAQQYQTQAKTIAYTNNYQTDLDTGIRTLRFDNKGDLVKDIYGLKGLKQLVYTSSGSQGLAITYTRNAFARIVSISREDKLGRTQRPAPTKSYSTHKSYSAAGLLQQIAIDSGSTNVLTYSYQYNPAGNLIKETIVSQTVKAPGRIIYTFGYNSENQLTAFNDTGSGRLYLKTKAGIILTGKNYQYGLNGNLKVVSTDLKQTNPKINAYHYNLSSGHPNQLHNSNQNVAYVYLPNGQIVSDPKGGKYSYNDLNQLRAYHSNINYKPIVRDQYVYGPDGLLASEHSDVKRLDPGLRRDDRGSVYFDYSKSGVLLGQQQGEVRTFTLPGLANFTYKGQGLKAAPTMLYSVRQGNVAMTANSSNQITSQNLYLPYGVQTSLIKPQPAKQAINIASNSFGYTGQTKDASTGLMMLGAFREYQPKLGRYIQPDSYNVFSRTPVFNRYAYVKGNPELFTDPSGHSPQSSWSSFIHSKDGILSLVAVGAGIFLWGGVVFKFGIEANRKPSTSSANANKVAIKQRADEVGPKSEIDLSEYPLSIMQSGETFGQRARLYMDARTAYIDILKKTGWSEETVKGLDRQAYEDPFFLTRKRIDDAFVAASKNKEAQEKSPEPVRPELLDLGSNNEAGEYLTPPPAAGKRDSIDSTATAAHVMNVDLDGVDDERGLDAQKREARQLFSDVGDGIAGY